MLVTTCFSYVCILYQKSLGSSLFSHFRWCRKLLLWTGTSDEASQDTHDTQPPAQLWALQKNGDLCKYSVICVLSCSVHFIVVLSRTLYLTMLYRCSLDRPGQCQSLYNMSSYLLFCLLHNSKPIFCYLSSVVIIYSHQTTAHWLPQRPHKATQEEMTKFHSDDYIRFLRSIRPDNMSEYNKQMQRCESSHRHVQWYDMYCEAYLFIYLVL